MRAYLEIDLTEGDRASGRNPLGSMRSESESRAQCKLGVYIYDRGALEIARGQRRYMSDQRVYRANTRTSVEYERIVIKQDVGQVAPPRAVRRAVLGM